MDKPVFVQIATTGGGGDLAESCIELMFSDLERLDG
jgi:hypothetical protein